VALSSDKKPSIGLVVSILVLGSATSVMSTDMYTPSLPDLTREFDTTATRVKLTISLNMLAFGLAQLIHGPLSDRFGRRPVLLCSLACVATLSFLCTLSGTIEQLIAARILLGLAAAAEAVIGLAIIKDLFEEKQQVKVLALFGMVVAVAPAVAPILGGYLHVAFGWESNFYFISGMAVVAWLAVYQFLPESTIPDSTALQPKRLLNSYTRLFKNAEFISYSAMLGIALGLVFVFVTGAPFVLIELLGVHVEQFGYYQASIVVAFFIGSLMASWLADRWSAQWLLLSGVSLIVIGCILVTVVVSFGMLTPTKLAVAYSVMTFGMGPLFAVGPSRALRSIDGQTGSASALLSGTEQILAGAAAVAISVLHDGSAQPMAWVTVALALMLLAVYWHRRRAEDRIH